MDLEKVKWVVYQEWDNVYVTDSYGEYSEEDFEYFALRCNVISGEDYGRANCEEYLGDLMSLEGLTQAIVEFAAACARVIPLVNPAGLTNIDDVAGAANGQYIPGRKDDITMASLDKFADFQVASRAAEAMEMRLSFAFLLNSAVQRNAERVTAEEIRYVAGELEQAIGGIYSLLNRELQLPLVRHLV